MPDQKIKKPGGRLITLPPGAPGESKDTAQAHVMMDAHTGRMTEMALKVARHDRKKALQKQLEIFNEKLKQFSAEFSKLRAEARNAAASESGHFVRNSKKVVGLLSSLSEFGIKATMNDMCNGIQVMDSCINGLTSMPEWIGGSQVVIKLNLRSVQYLDAGVVEIRGLKVRFKPAADSLLGKYIKKIRKMDKYHSDLIKAIMEAKKCLANVDADVESMQVEIMRTQLKSDPDIGEKLTKMIDGSKPTILKLPEFKA